MKILVTGAAGFIGFHLSRKLLEHGHEVVGLDNINNYYDIKLKLARLKELGIEPDIAKKDKLLSKSPVFPSFSFIKLDLEDRKELPRLFKGERFEVVCNLAAQAGVRYSLDNPEAYIDSNIVGFLNVLECCRNNKIKHLIYASSSSVYGGNTKIPFETSDSVDHPLSLYAASKKSNELMAHTYGHLYGFLTTGLRFFTVYGPWGRPDMAMFLFTEAILKEKPIKVFNNGEMERDFTYIDDIVNGILKVVEKSTDERIKKNAHYKIYNIGNNKSVRLLDLIEAIESTLKIKAVKEMLPLQPGDVKNTWANVDTLVSDYGYKPNTSIHIGVTKFVNWYKKFYQVN